MIWWFIRFAFRFVLNIVRKESVEELILGYREIKETTKSAELIKELDKNIERLQEKKEEMNTIKFLKRNIIYKLQSLEPTMYKNLKWYGILDMLKGEKKGFEIMKDNFKYNYLYFPWYSKIPSSIRNTNTFARKHSIVMKRIERAELKEQENINLLFSKQNIREFNKLTTSQQQLMVNEMEKKFIGFQKERERIHDQLIDSYKRNGYDFDLYKYLFQKKNNEEMELTFKFFPVSFGLGKQYRKNSNFNKRAWVWNNKTKILKAYFKSDCIGGEVKEYLFNVPTIEDIYMIMNTLTIGHNIDSDGKGTPVNGILSHYRMSID